jgi:hypothetical protein
VKHVSSAVLEINFKRIQADKELVQILLEWSTPIDDDGKQTYIVTGTNPIHHRLLSQYVSKELVKKAANLSLEKRKVLISDLKGESAASAYHAAILEADAINRLICG